MPETMTIGRLAKAAGVNVETIRYYQRRGLIGEPRKPPGGHRRYAHAVLRQVAFIRRAQQVGFTLEEIGRLLELCQSDDQSEALAIAEQRRAVVDSRVGELERMREDLDKLIAACRKAKGTGPSPLLKLLFGE
jgi:MerR family transcriptional regulator, mercuric resistance operon regulatory protein